MRGNTPTMANQLQSVMIYAADLELEVDRLRRRDSYLQREAGRLVRQIQQLCDEVRPLPEVTDALPAIAAACREFRNMLRDVRDPPGYHPAFDQVTSIAVRPLAERIFDWQQRLSGARSTVLRLDLESEQITWFPARLRHILENLIANALRFPDPAKGEFRVGLSLHTTPDSYELQLTDNGLGMPHLQVNDLLEFFYRAAPIREANLDVTFAVVKLLVEQCCGSMLVTTGEGLGTNVTVLLPRYDLEDYIE